MLDGTRVVVLYTTQHSTLLRALTTTYTVLTSCRTEYGDGGDGMMRTMLQSNEVRLCVCDMMN